MTEDRPPMPVDVPRSLSAHSSRKKAARAAWGVVWALLYRPSPRVCHGWRRFLLRLFGARVARGAHPYPSARIWAPWNLEMGEHSCLADRVDCYSVDRITVGPHATVSQYSYLCTASHDYRRPDMPVITAPIVIGARAWVAADVFVGPGVTVGEGAVVGARSSVFRDVEPWVVVAGAPARFITRRAAEPNADGW
jgi:putative colanic acid biosynthesis acetyltransferase WcaF